MFFTPGLTLGDSKLLVCKTNKVRLVFVTTVELILFTSETNAFTFLFLTTSCF